MNTKPRPYCLSIAGFDPCGGAGVLADIKTFEALNCQGMGVITTTTFQNEKEFYGLTPMDYRDIYEQIEALRDYPIAAVKIGLIISFRLFENIIDLLDTYFPRVPIVWDPILKATAGYSFLSDEAVPDKIARRITLITPNISEFSQLNIRHLTDSLLTSVLLKGGHRTNAVGTDVLYHKGKEITLKGEKFMTHAQKHGTGCVLSSAIVAYLSKGFSMSDACIAGKKYVEKFMLSNTTRLGYHSSEAER